jgi:MFS family permease
VQLPSASPLPVSGALAAPPRSRAGRNEWLLVVFTAFTNVADAITRVALPLLARHLTRSPGLIAVVGVLITLPWLLTALPVGVLVDRVNRRVLMVAAETARLSCVGVLLAAVLANHSGLPLIYLVAIVLGVAEVVALTSSAAAVPAAVPKERWLKASTRITAMENLNAFLGAPVGGLLVAVGFMVAFGSTAVVYAAGLVMLALLVGNFRPRQQKESPARRRSVHAEISDGVRFLLRSRLLRTMAGLISVLAGCWSAWLALLPAYAPAPGPLGLTAREYGLLLTSLGAGGVIGALIVGPVNRLIGRRWSMFADIIGTFVLVAVPAGLPAARSSALAVGAAALVAGAGGTMWTVNSRVIIQVMVPNEMLGRFNAASLMIGWGTAPVAAAIGGVLAQFTSYHVAFGFFAVICLVTVIPFLRVVTDEALAHADNSQPEPREGPS